MKTFYVYSFLIYAVSDSTVEMKQVTHLGMRKCRKNQQFIVLMSVCRVVELTGDVTPDMKSIAQADLIVTTPEKWDGVSRSWQNRSYVQKVALIIIDEIHLLGESFTQDKM